MLSIRRKSCQFFYREGILFGSSRGKKFCSNRLQEDLPQTKDPLQVFEPGRQQPEDIILNFCSQAISSIIRRLISAILLQEIICCLVQAFQRFKIFFKSSIGKSSIEERHFTSFLVCFSTRPSVARRYCFKSLQLDDLFYSQKTYFVYSIAGNNLLIFRRSKGIFILLGGLQGESPLQVCLGRGLTSFLHREDLAQVF